MKPTAQHHERRTSGRCRHELYLVTCEEFDDLWRWTGGLCGICGGTEESVNGQRFVIDHDHELGEWAVRGLLCVRCNALEARQARFMPVGRTWSTATQDYLARPWRTYGTRDEPDAEFVVTRWARCWRKTETGWVYHNWRAQPEHVTSFYRYRRSYAWHELVRTFGPTIAESSTEDDVGVAVRRALAERRRSRVEVPA